MKLSELDQHIFSYYLDHGANNLTGSGRFFPYLELFMTVRDRIRFDTRKFGAKVTSHVDTVTRAFLDLMIERGAFSTKKPAIGGTMHQFQEKEYRSVLRELQESDDIIREAADQDDAFWADRFRTLTTEPAE